MQTSAELTTVSHGVSGSLPLPLCHTFSFTPSETKAQQPWWPPVLVLRCAPHLVRFGAVSQQAITGACVLAFLEACLPSPPPQGLWDVAANFMCVEKSLLWRSPLCSRGGCLDILVAVTERLSPLLLYKLGLPNQEHLAFHRKTTALRTVTQRRLTRATAADWRG